MMNFRAFTLTADKRLLGIKFKVGVAETSSDGQLPNKESIQQFGAVWHTACARSAISTKVINQLNLEVVQAVKVNINGKLVDKPAFLVDIFLPNRIRLTSVLVSAIEDEGINVDVVIGMDIISQGDSTLSYAQGKTLFSFRVPSLAALDYCRKQTDINTISTPRVAFKKVPKTNTKKVQKINTVVAKRNGMCHCGSGKKFKNCCGS